MAEATRTPSSTKKETTSSSNTEYDFARPAPATAAIPMRGPPAESKEFWQQQTRSVPAGPAVVGATRAVSAVSTTMGKQAYYAPISPHSVRPALMVHPHFVGKMGPMAMTPVRAASAGASSTSSHSPTMLGLTKPRLVPPLPFFLTHYVVPVSCKLATLKTALKNALQTGAVDFEYNENKWKAKCYIYRPRGAVAFVLRAYATGSGATSTTVTGSGGANGAASPAHPPVENEAYIVELQRRKGCHSLFRDAYDDFVLALASAGLVPVDEPCVQHARTTRGAAAAAENAPVGDTSCPPTQYAVSPRHLEIGMADEVDDVDALNALAAHMSTLSSKENAVRTAAEEPTVVCAFVNLATMLSSEYNDVSAPAAQAIASLACTTRVRNALGKKCYAESTAVEVTPDERLAATAVKTLFGALLQKIRNPYASIEARTAAAIAIALLARDISCGDALMRFHAPQILLDTAHSVIPSASAAALRRECLHAVWALIATSVPHAVDAIQADCLLRITVLAGVPFSGVDPSFDTFAIMIKSRLESCTRQSPLGSRQVSAT